MTYQLRITFKSNERPWHGTDTPLRVHQPTDDDAAIQWARDMARGLGRDYDVQLFDDDRRIDFEEPQE